MPDRATPSPEPRREYSSRLESRRDWLAHHVKQHRSLGNFRLLVLLAAAATAFGAFGREVVSGWWLLVPACIYFWVGSRLQRVETECSTLTRAIALYERALARLEGRWQSTGPDGARFLDDRHLYGRDLDVFGEASLFRLLSNARTRMGEETLAAWLSAPSAPDVVKERQQAGVELAPNLDLREDLAVMGEDVEAGVHPEALAAWGEREPVLEAGPFRAVARVLAVLGAGAIVAFFVYVAAGLKAIELSPETLVAVVVYFAVAAVSLVGVMLRFKRRTDRIIEEVDEAAADLALLSGVLARLEAEEFTSPRLRALRAELDVEGRAPSYCIRRLNFLTDLVDSRHNQFVALIAPFLLWDLHLGYAIEDWRRTSGPALRRWLNAVGEMEALSSLAGYRYEHPDDVFPEFVTESPVFHGEELRHPLLAEDVAIANDVKIGSDLRALVVSGSNMSGKSTLLRTVGLNAVLAQAGAPVRAKRLRLSPLSVGASIQIQDSLQEGTSRFFAEITRLGRIMAKARGEHAGNDKTAPGTEECEPVSEAARETPKPGGPDANGAEAKPGGEPTSTERETDTVPPVLFLVDELLHGTNSHDRRIGAEAIVRGLVDHHAIGLVTTHDLALAHIADALGPAGRNVHFEDHLADGHMRFDYRLRPGVVEKSNAIALMRSVGLEV